MIAPVQRRTLRSRLSGHLFEAILRGDLRPGERIVEGKLAEQLGVAKTTLREALQELEHQGLLTKYDHRGSFVTKLTQEDIVSAYAVRLQLEPFAAALAHQRMNAKHFSQLTHLFDKIRNAGERRDFIEVSKTDAELHQLIWQQSGNKLLERALKLVCFPLWAFELIRLFAAPTYDFAAMLEEHRALLAVLKKGGPEKVRRTFQQMLEVFRDQDIRNLRALDADPRADLKNFQAKKKSGFRVWESFRDSNRPRTEVQ